MLKQLAGTAVLVLASVSGGASAQTFPTKNVTVVIPLAASAAFYIVLRQMADQIQAKTGRPIVFDTAIGAGGTVAPPRVMRAEADGHTIGLTYAAPMTLSPLMGKDSPYDPIKDFSYITMLTQLGIFFVAGANFGPSSLNELVAAAKAKPDTIKVGYTGAGSLVGILQLEEAAGIKLFKVPYKSGGQFDAAVLAGEVDLVLTTVGSAAGQISAGKMKPVFFGGKRRSPLHPNVQSVSEVFPNLEVSSWYGLYAPAGTPADRIEWHHREWTAALRDPKIAERMQAVFGYEIVAGTPKQFTEQVQRELVANRRTVTTHNVKE